MIVEMGIVTDTNQGKFDEMIRTRSSKSAWLLLCLFVCSCNVVHWQGGRINRRLKQSGLELHTVQLGASEVQYWKGGKGPTVLLLHGFGASAKWQWYEQVRALAPHFEVVVPDLLWFGGSSSNERNFSLDAQVQMVIDLLDRLEVGRTHVVGISYGGLVAYELAGAQPDRVDKVVLANSPGRTYRRTDLQALLKRFQVDSIAELLIPDDETDIERLLELAYDDPPYTPRFAREQVLQTLYAEHSDEQTALLVEAIGSLDELANAPDNYAASTLLIWGRHDPVFPLEIGKRLEERLAQDTELTIIDDTRHAPNLEQPEQFNRAILQFFTSSSNESKTP